MSDRKKGTGANKMFLQWCRDELVLSFIFVQRFVSWDKTRLRKGTTAETQTLWPICGTSANPEFR
jgi:hypothetical protein